MTETAVHIIVFGFYTVVGLVTLHATHFSFPDPYIDEYFHVPQVQHYCRGYFDQWDSHITTPPGLYVVTLFFVKPLSWFVGSVSCDIFYLRLVNVFGTTINFYIFLLIKRKIHNNKSNWLSLIEACSLASFPILYIYSFLYYTEVFSVTFISIAYLLFLYDSHFMAALAGLVATCMRQTNIIWLAFFAAQKAFKVLTEVLSDGKSVTKRKKSARSPLSVILEGMRTPRAILAVAKSTFWYLVVGAAFAAFIVINGSVVLGDKDAHKPTIHIPQIFYFSVFCATFSPWQYITFLPRFLQIVRKKKFEILVTLILILLVVHFNTQQHLYLLSDNRHYMFYIWKNFYVRYCWFRYAMCPVYLYCLVCINEHLRPQGVFLRYFFFFSVIAELVPRWLLEPRYFIIPSIIYRLHTRTRSKPAAVTEFLEAIIANVALVYIYVACPFTTARCYYFPNNDDCVRYIW